MQLLMPGQTAYRDWGQLNIRIDRDHEGVSITVSGHHTLDRTFLDSDLAAGRTYLGFLRDAATAGQSVWQIEAAVSAPRRSLTRCVPTRTNVHLKPLTAAELDLIRSHRDGEVTTRPGQSWLMLRAIVRRGFGEPVYGRGRRIVAVRLNERGLDAAQTNEEIAA